MSDDTSDRFYKAAVDLYKDEHRRWNQWALFFFGALAATFVAWDNTLKKEIPLWIPSIVAAIISYFWTCSAQAIRRSTRAWQITIKRVEQDNVRPFTTHADEIKKNSA